MAATVTTPACPVRRATLAAKGGPACELRYYPRADRLEYPAGAAVPVVVLLWAKEMFRDGRWPAYCRWDGVRWGLAAA